MAGGGRCQVTLNAKHFAHLSNFHIPIELLEAAGVCSATDAEVRELLGLNGFHAGENLDGILFPYLDPTTGRRVGARVRLDRPLDDGGKYVSEPRCKHIFFPPGTSEVLKDAAVTAVIVEAEKSALALRALCDRTGAKLLPIAIGGCWGYRRTIGKKPLPGGGTEPEKGISPDFDLVTWPGRRTILAYDANAATNREVRRARLQAEREFDEREAKVAIANLPDSEAVNGPDDYIAKFGDEAMLAVLDAAASAIITVRVGEMPVAVDEAEQILLQEAERLRIFQRGELTRVIRLPQPHDAGGLRRPAGTVQLEPLNAVALRETFESIARFQRCDVDKAGKPIFTRIDCPARVPQTYCTRIGSWQLPVLAGIISAPIMRPDGTILSRPGFDQATGLYFDSDCDWPAIPDQPTREDAKKALVTLLLPFDHFPFVSPPNRAVHAAAILTAIQRRLLAACPMFAYSAPTMRSGKSLLARSVAIIATGRSAAASALSDDREEIRKAILSALREGHSIINFDNLEGVLASPDLSRAITEPIYSDRVLGESKKLYLPTNVLWTCTGNNLTFKGDLVTRIVSCRIDAQVEHPEHRHFDIPDLPRHLIENRPQLVAAALTILRAYHVADRPGQKLTPWGGFENWSDLIRSAVVWAGLADPCITRDTVIADDPEVEATAIALEELSICFGRNITFTLHEAREIARKRHPDKEDKPGDLCYPKLHEALAGVAGSRRDKIDPWKLAWWARHWVDRIVGGLSLRKAAESGNTPKWSIR
jgi:uncharacterized protein DUF3854